MEAVAAGAVQVGEHIAQHEEGLYDGELDPAEFDWHLVCGRRGHADVGELLLQDYDGSRYWCAGAWGQTVFRLLEDGEPVVDAL
jgi:hypothetical protein